jgi:NDP-sugar pyrophosphorylase family protein
MIEWIVKMLPEPQENITFICRKEHLDTLSYVKDELLRIAPKANIFSIDNWQKQGPVPDVLKASSVIDYNEPVLISYCDYYMHWDYIGFKREAARRNCEGAVPCYSGFHPHLIPPKNLYASCKVDSAENLIEIREKFTWENDKTKTRHSPGAYYFKSGELMKKYLQKLVDDGEQIKGEYYASLPYNNMVKDGLKVWCPANVSFFCQWGTPEDLNEYLFWVNIIRNYCK